MKENHKELELTKKFWILIISICVVFIVLVTVGFMMFASRKADVIEKEVDGGYVRLNYSTPTNALSITNASPMSDSNGIKLSEEGTYFDFSVEVDLKDAKEVDYEISINKDNAKSTITDEDIRIYLEKEESGTYNSILKPQKYVAVREKSDIGTSKGSMILTEQKTKKSGTNNYRLRMWLSDKDQQKSGNYFIDVNINAVAK